MRLVHSFDNINSLHVRCNRSINGRTSFIAHFSLHYLENISNLSNFMASCKSFYNAKRYIDHIYEAIIQRLEHALLLIPVDIRVVGTLYNLHTDNFWEIGQFFEPEHEKCTMPYIKLIKLKLHIASIVCMKYDCKHYVESN